jgi:hypothetical protein
MSPHKRTVTSVIGVTEKQRKRSGRNSSFQSRAMSLIEAGTNVVVGYGIAVATQMVVFPAFGLTVATTDNLLIGLVFTSVSLARSYAVRRLFIWLQTSNP